MSYDQYKLAHPESWENETDGITAEQIEHQRFVKELALENIKQSFDEIGAELIEYYTAKIEKLNPELDLFAFKHLESFNWDYNVQHLNLIK